MKVICTKNTSTILPFKVGETYELGKDFGGGMFEIWHEKGKIIAPLSGYYLNFSIA